MKRQSRALFSFPKQTNPKCKNPNLFSGIYIIIPNIRIHLKNPENTYCSINIMNRIPEAKLGEGGKVFLPSPSLAGGALPKG
jgi:hypothetical protein